MSSIKKPKWTKIVIIAMIVFMAIASIAGVIIPYLPSSTNIPAPLPTTDTSVQAPSILDEFQQDNTSTIGEDETEVDTTSGTYTTP